MVFFLLKFVKSWKSIFVFGPIFKKTLICSYLSWFDPFWSNLISFRPFWSNLIQFDPIWSDLIQFEPFKLIAKRKKQMSKLVTKLVHRSDNRWRWCRGRFNFRQRTLIGLSEVFFQPRFFSLVLVLIFKINLGYLN